MPGTAPSCALRQLLPQHLRRACPRPPRRLRVAHPMALSRKRGLPRRPLPLRASSPDARSPARLAPRRGRRLCWLSVLPPAGRAPGRGLAACQAGSDRPRRRRRLACGGLRGISITVSIIGLAGRRAHRGIAMEGGVAAPSATRIGTLKAAETAIAAMVRPLARRRPCVQSPPPPGAKAPPYTPRPTRGFGDPNGPCGTRA